MEIRFGLSYLRFPPPSYLLTVPPVRKLSLVFFAYGSPTVSKKDEPSFFLSESVVFRGCAAASKCLLEFPGEPKGSSRAKSSTESKFSTGTIFATTIAKRCGECSEMLLFFRGFAKGWFPKGWFWRMFPRNENRNEGTFAKTTLLETALLSPNDPFWC